MHQNFRIGVSLFQEILHHIPIFGLTEVTSICRLPEQLRAVVILRYFAGYTQAETAESLKIPQGTAATRQRRALELLRLELGEEEKP